MDGRDELLPDDDRPPDVRGQPAEQRGMALEVRRVGRRCSLHQRRQAVHEAGVAAELHLEAQRLAFVHRHRTRLGHRLAQPVARQVLLVAAVAGLVDRAEQAHRLGVVVASLALTLGSCWVLTPILGLEGAILARLGVQALTAAMVWALAGAEKVTCPLLSVQAKFRSSPSTGSSEAVPLRFTSSTGQSSQVQE